MWCGGGGGGCLGGGGGGGGGATDVAVEWGALCSGGGRPKFDRGGGGEEDVRWSRFQADHGAVKRTGVRGK